MNVVTLASGVGRTEGPVVSRRGGVAFASMSHGRVYRVVDRGPELLSDTGGTPNGLAEDAQGLVYVAQAGAPRPLSSDSPMVGGVQVVAMDGTWRWLTRDPIYPNDLCFGPDGLLYVTDPTRRPARDDGRLWRCNPVTGDSEILASVNWFPNGIGFGPEDDWLYVASTGDQRILRLPLTGGRLGRAEIAIQMLRGHPDGFAFDMDGNIIIAAVSSDGTPGTIQVWSRDGKILDTFHPESLDAFRPGKSAKYTNVALGSDRRLVVSDADGGSILAVTDWPTSGLPLHPFRSAVTLPA